MCFYAAIMRYYWSKSLITTCLPKVMVTKQGPVHNVEKDEAGWEQPPGDSVHQHCLLPPLLHQVPDFFLTFGMGILKLETKYYLNKSCFASLLWRDLKNIVYITSPPSHLLSFWREGRGNGWEGLLAMFFESCCIKVYYYHLLSLNKTRGMGRDTR